MIYDRTAGKARTNPPVNNPVNEKGQEQIRVDGFEQVLAMLRIADRGFRDSLLKRLAARDPDLARSLLAALDT